MINFERLDAAITYGHEHPDEFFMWDWYVRRSCGTVACLAGTALLQAGYEPQFDGGGRALNTLVLDDDGDEYAVTAVWKDGVAYPVPQTAAELLGLTEDQAGEIFNLANLHEVIEMRNRWALELGIPERAWGES